MHARKKSEVPGMEEPLQCKYCKTRHGMFYTVRFYNMAAWHDYLLQRLSRLRPSQRP